MRLTKLVPALGLFAAIAAPVSAIELADGTLTIGGDVTFTAEHTQAEPRVGNSSSSTDFSAEAYLSVAYRVGEDVEAFIGIESDSGSIVLDEAFISWGFADNLSLTVGLYANWLVSESGAVDDSLTDGLTGMNVTGFALGYSMEIDADSSFDVALHVVEEIWGFGTKAGDLAIGLGGAYSNDALGTLGASVSFQNNAAADSSVLGINVFAEITAVEDFTFGMDFHFIDFDKGVTFAGAAVDGILGFGAYANYSAIPTPFPSSVTLGGSFVQYSRVVGDSWSDFMVQAAYLTNPTGNDNFEVNFEVNYTVFDKKGAANAGKDWDLGLVLEFVAIIP